MGLPVSGGAAQPVDVAHTSKGELEGGLFLDGPEELTLPSFRSQLSKNEQ